MKPDQALIIFVKNPVAGRVKTRLAADTGVETALQVYLQLVSLTLQQARKLSDTDVHVFFTGEPPAAIGLPGGFIPQLQQGDGLGERMANAFQKLLQEGYKKVCIIGSDCPQLQTGHAEQAFRALDAVDIVIGPARDGGYYLMGMKQDHTFVFGLDSWSHGKVLEQTMERITLQKRSYALLETLSDLDDVADYERLKHHLDKLPTA